MTSDYSGNFQYDVIHGLARLETGMEGLNARMDKLNGQVDRHTDKLEEHGNALVTLEELERRIQSHETQLDLHQTALDQSSGGTAASGHIWSALWAGACVGGAELLRYLYSIGHR